MPANITAMVEMDIEHLGVKPVALALENCQVHIYLDKHRVDNIPTPEVINVMKYGKYGRESGTLVMVSRQGTLTVRILKRTVRFSPKEVSSSPVVASKMLIPKKTKLFVDQSMREKEEYLSKLLVI